MRTSTSLSKTSLRALFFHRFPVIALVCAYFMLSPMMQALTSPPDGGYPGGNTAEGQNALSNLISGTYNTAVGFFSIGTLSTGQFCTGIGAGALLLNTANENTATGAGALLSDTIGFSKKEIQELTAELKEQATQIQKVSAQTEQGKSALLIVETNP